MFSTYVVELGGQQAGIVVLERTGFRFFAALKKVRALEGARVPNQLLSWRTSE